MSADKELWDKKNAAWVAAKAVNDEAGEWTAERQAKWDELNKIHDEAAKAIEDHRQSAAAKIERDGKLKAMEDATKQQLGNRGIGLDGDKRQELDPENTSAKQERTKELALQAWCIAQTRGELRDDHKEACRLLGINPNAKELAMGEHTDKRYGDPAWSHDGRNLPREVRVGLDVTTSGAAKETIPAGFMAELEQKTLAYSSVRGVCRVIQTSTGNSMPWPVVDDTGNAAAILSEATTIGTSVDPTFSAITFLAYKLSSKPVFASHEIIEDSAFNLASYLADAMGTRFGRGEATYTTTGTNSSQPQGVVNCSGTGVTSLSATAFTPDELLGLIHSLDPSYRALPSTGFMMHDTALLYVRKFKDANGQYLWQPGFSSDVPDRLAGYPVSINQSMEPLVSNIPVTAKKHVIFAAFEKYVIRDIGGVRMYHLTERYRDVDQDAFVAFKRLDARALNVSAVKALLQA